MKKIVLILVFALLTVMVIGCAKDKTASNANKPAETKIAAPEAVSTTTKKEIPEDAPDETKAEDLKIEDNQQAPASDNPMDSYTAYMEAKAEIVSRMSEAISNDPDNMMAMMSFLSIVSIDFAMWPAAFLGQDEETLKLGMGFLGIEDIDYEINNGQSSVRYQDNDGNEVVFNSLYDKSKDHNTYRATIGGKDYVYAEYVRTDYGYVGQYYMPKDEDGSFTVFLVTIAGENGTVGFNVTKDRLPPLTGNESFDFPKAAPEWYSLIGDKVTGVSSEGKSVDVTLDRDLDED